MRSILRLTILAYLAVLIAAAPDMLSLLPQYENCHAYNYGTPSLSPPGQGVIFWTIDSTNGVIRYGLTCTGTKTQEFGPAFCGWGIKTAAGAGEMTMTPTDANIGLWNGGSPTVGDYYLSDYRTCSGGNGVCLDSSKTPAGVDDVTNSSGFMSGTGSDLYVGYQWTRPLGSSDQWDTAIIDADIQILLSIKSAESSPGLEFHDDFYMASDVLNLMAAPTCPGDCNGHGVCTKGCCVCNPGYAGYDCSIESGNAAGTLSPGIDKGYYNKSAEIGPGFTIHWSLFGDEDDPEGYVEFAMEYDSGGWGGFGRSLHTRMVPADVQIGVVSADGLSVTVTDSKIIQRTVPGIAPDTGASVNGANDILAFGGSQPSEGKTIVKFQKKYNTNDTNGDYIIRPSKSQAYIYAYGDGDTLQKHPFHNKNPIKINLKSGYVFKPWALKVPHGWLMWIAWGVLIPVGIAIARFGKARLGVWWFHIHRGCNLTGVLITIAAFILGVIQTVDVAQFSFAHGIIGLIITILAIVQPILGQIADIMFKPDRTSTPIFPDLVHWVIGYLVAVLALINIWLGVVLYRSSTVIYVLYGIWFSVVIIVYIVLTILHLVAPSIFGGGGHGGGGKAEPMMS